jgi:hypothetical protein
MLSSLAQNRKGASLKSDGTEENIPNIWHVKITLGIWGKYFLRKNSIDP